jgi:hypothetical protein
VPPADVWPAPPPVGAPPLPEVAGTGSLGISVQATTHAASGALKAMKAKRRVIMFGLDRRA